MTSPHEDDLRAAPKHEDEVIGLIVALEAAVVTLKGAVSSRADGDEKGYADGYCAGVERAFTALRSVGTANPDTTKGENREGSVAP